MKWINKHLFQLGYWASFIAYVLTKDVWFALVQMVCLILWFIESKSKVFNNTVTVNHNENSNELFDKVKNIEQMVSLQKPSIIVKGSELTFLKRITGDGEALVDLQTEDCPWYDDNYKLTPLSISRGTYIAHGFNSYIVKLK